jgi:hypothetical protein
MIKEPTSTPSWISASASRRSASSELSYWKSVGIAVLTAELHVQIASVLHVSRQTLENNFDDELKNGRARKLLQTLCLLDKQAKRGSTAAAKYLCNVFQNGAPGQHLGKKAQRARDAAEALRDSPWYDLIGRPDRTSGAEAGNGQ